MNKLTRTNYDSDHKSASAILRLFSNNIDDVRIYRPRLNKLTGSHTASILLSQIIFRWEGQGHRPFYKFSAPCNHPLYKKGDSWQEELDFSRREFEGARALIGVRVKYSDRAEALKDNILVYWRDPNNVTWYELNESLLADQLVILYSYDDPLSSNQPDTNSQLGDAMHNPYNPNVQNAQSGDCTNCTLPLTETTEKTTETLYTDDDLDNYEEEKLSDNSHELSPAIAEQKILFSLGEKKNGNDAKLNTQQIIQTPSPKSSELSPTTPGGILLFAKLSNEAHAKGRKSPKSFASIAQRDAFLEVEERLTINQLEQAIDNALRNEITARRNIINYLSKYKARSVHAPVLGYKHTTIVNEDGSVYF